MHRRPIAPRPDRQARLKAIDFAFPEIGGEPYWVEDAHWTFTLEQIERDIEAPTELLGRLCESVVDRVIGDERLLTRLGIPEHAWDLIAESRRRGDRSLYGRFDLAYDGKTPAKLLEYNADTPTALYEAAVVQWYWLTDLLERGVLPEGTDQYNSLHERLIARLAEIVPDGMLHLAGQTESVEDAGTLAYLADCALAAGRGATVLDMSQIGLAGDRFVDVETRPIDRLFKLYPWEWLFADDFGRSPAMRATRFLEPPWKAILSNKGILPLLWEMAPGHPNLLPAHFADDPRAERLGPHRVIKPLLSREGADVTLLDHGRVVEKTDGTYGAEGYVVQTAYPLPAFDGWYPVLGSWLVGDVACGLGVREDATRITTDRSRFVPHVITP